GDVRGKVLRASLALDVASLRLIGSAESSICLTGAKITSPTATDVSVLVQRRNAETGAVATTIYNGADEPLTAFLPKALLGGWQASSRREIKKGQALATVVTASGAPASRAIMEISYID